MLNIYIGREHLPKDKEFIFDPEALTLSLDLLADDTVTDILYTVEQAVPQSSDTFVDRFGRGLYRTCLSASSKILLGAHLTDFIVNGDELGSNAFDYLNKLSHGSIYFSEFLFDVNLLNLPVTVNNTVCRCSDDVFNLLRTLA